MGRDQQENIKAMVCLNAKSLKDKDKKYNKSIQLGAVSWNIDIRYKWIILKKILQGS